MAFKTRHSKFKHVFGTAYKKDLCYDNIKITKSPWESPMCDVNGKFVAVVLESQGGGAFTVFPIDKPGRMDINQPKVSGHKNNVLDIKWNPFNENIIASASEDCCVKIWEIPDEGLADNLSDSVVTLEGHNRKVGCIAWHPTAADIIVSAGADSRLVIWNVRTEDALFEVDIGGDLIYCISWNYNGSLLAVTSKNKKLRVIDPRRGEIISEVECHGSPKPSQVTFCGTLNFLCTTGFSRSNERQLSVWDLNKLDKPLSTMNIDSGSGVMLIYYDEGTKMVYLVGKGDGTICYFELFPESPYVQYLSMYNHPSAPQRSCGYMPKRYLSHSECEIARFYKLHNKGMIEPVTMTVPRKSNMFQDDLYPPCAAGEPSLSADEWAAGQDKPPALVNITKDGLGSVVGGATIPMPSYSSTGSSEAINARQSPKRESTSSANHGEVDRLTEENRKLKAEIEQLKSQLKEIISSMKKLVQ